MRSFGAPDLPRAAILSETADGERGEGVRGEGHVLFLQKIIFHWGGAAAEEEELSINQED